MTTHLQSHLESFTDPPNHDVSVDQTSFDPAYIEVEPGDKITFTSTRKGAVTVTISPSDLFSPETASVVLASEGSMTLTVRAGSSTNVTYDISAPLEVDSAARGIGKKYALATGMTGTIKVGGSTVVGIPTRVPRTHARLRQEEMEKSQGR